MTTSEASEAGVELLEEQGFGEAIAFPNWSGTARVTDRWSGYVNAPKQSTSNSLLPDGEGGVKLAWGGDVKSVRLYQPVDIQALQDKGGPFWLRIRIEGPDTTQLMPSIKAIQIQRIGAGGGETVSEFNNFAASATEGRSVLTARASLPKAASDEQHRLTIQFRVSAGKAAISNISVLAVEGASPPASGAAADRAPPRANAFASLPKRRGLKPTMAVVTWDLAHNPAGRAFMLAEIAKSRFDVDLVGPLFPRFGNDVWPPVGGAVDIPVVSLRATTFADIFDQALDLAESRTYDYVYVCKPRMPALIIASVLAARSGARVLVDIDEDEMAFFGGGAELDLRDALEAATEDAADAFNPFGKCWTAASVRMARRFASLTVSNEALQARFGGTVIRHARDEKSFRPSEEVRNAARAELGLGDDDRVILFIGTPRAHKGVVTIARVLNELADPRLVFVVVGTIRDEKVAQALAECDRARLKLFPDQPWSRLSSLIQAGDVAPVLLDASRPISATQMPAKVTDALACGLKVVASPTPPLRRLIESGLVTAIADENELKLFLQDFAGAPREAANSRASLARRQEFLGEFSHAVNASRLRLVAELAAEGDPSNVLTLFDELIELAEARGASAELMSRLKDCARIAREPKIPARPVAAPRDAAPALVSPKRSALDLGDPRPTLNWVIGPDSNIEWAYGNNAKRLSAGMPGWRHDIAGSTPTDVALYFDAIVAERYPQESAASVLRVGGPRPLDRLFEADEAKLRDGLSKFDAVITLNAALQRRVSAVHANAWLIPNGLDLTVWSPRRLPREDRPFTIGFAASAGSSAERAVKGLDHVIEAAALAGVELRRVHKGAEQVKHSDMIDGFYAHIDALVHPVAAGREGCSNVIMEALSVGVPVITTEHAGFHSEMLRDGENVLFCVQDARDVADKIALLRDSPELARRLSVNSRLFAEQRHDIGLIARKYGEVIASAHVNATRRRSAPSVTVSPFWRPAGKFASSRLRGDRPSAILAKHPAAAMILPDETAASNAAVVIQSAEDPLFDRLSNDRGQFLVYDVCDRYFEDAKIFKTPTGEVNSLERFGQLADRANVLIAPTTELKAELASRRPDKPVYYVPEALDYTGVFHDARPLNKQVVWFGSPQRGNFDSAKWLLDDLRTRHGYDVRLLTRRSYFSKTPIYQDCAEDWALDTFVDKLQQASICVVSHALDEETKSPNRFVTAVGHGVPTIVSQSRPCEEMLRAAGCDWAIVSSSTELDEAVRRLEDPAQRADYIRSVQRVLDERHGDNVVRRAYERLFSQLTYRPGLAPRNVAFVTHNLNFGEGAPKSLFELAIGLRSIGAATPFVYCAARGDLERLYQEQGVPVATFSSEFRPPMRTLNQRFAEIREAFQLYLQENRIQHVVANTIKSAPFALFAKEMGIPASIIIRESFAREQRFDYYSEEAAKAARTALVAADNVIFVAENTRTMWAEEAMSPSLRLISNGVDARPFAPALALTRQQARETVGLPQSGTVALCVGTINERKGQRQIVTWFAELAPEVKAELTLVFVGATQGRSLNEFNAFLDTIEAADRARIVIVPTTPDIGTYYRAADMFLMNSSQESYPRSTMEALLFGLPVISSAVFGVLEQIDDDGNGFLYPFDDGALWRERVTELVRDPLRRHAMSVEAARSFWRLTTHAEMLHEYRCIIDQD